MNRIDSLFQHAARPLRAIYFTAGSTAADDALPIITALARQGADLIEVGVPFSDPVADGPVIQQASARALRHGLTLRGLMRQLRPVRRAVAHTPIVLMSYLNPIVQYGFEQLAQDCADCGIDGLIIPDLPVEEYNRRDRAIMERHGLHLPLLITPETDEARIRRADEAAGGFLYVVSTAATTGAQTAFSADTERYLARVAAMGLRHPLMVGFGISGRATRQVAERHAAGCIIGSRFMQLLTEEQGRADRAYVRLTEQLA